MRRFSASLALLFLGGALMAQEAGKPDKLAPEKHVELLQMTTVRGSKEAELSAARQAAEAIPRLEKELEALNKKLGDWVTKNSPCLQGRIDIEGQWECPKIAPVPPPAQ